jgi:alpha-L-rhamnosidase-like protein
LSWTARALVFFALSVVAFALWGAGGAAVGSFASSDPLLNEIWADSARTAADALVPGPLTKDALGRACAIDLPVVIVDGTVRDRCPYVGDEAVVGRTLDASTPRWDVQKGMLEWFAAHQRSDGEIPASPLLAGSVILIDYNAYWIQALFDYVLASGDMALPRKVWPSLVKLLDVYYPAQNRGGLLANNARAGDYAFHRSGRFVAYYGAQYAFALRLASRLAGWVGDAKHASTWAARRAGLARPFRVAFWDRAAGAFRDTTEDSSTHPQDAQAFAILGGLATAQQAASALAYLDRHEQRNYGNTVSDTNNWDTASLVETRDRVYPFISYFEVLARYAAHEDASALELVRREWGYMAKNGPRSTMWETIGPFGGGPTNNPRMSWDAGWSSGAAPVLTTYVLGVQPTSPGYATFTVTPHKGDLSWARGSVVTPHGVLKVSWKLDARGSVRVSVAAPRGTRWTNRPA